METLITIRPFDLENRVIRKNTTRVPGTIRKSQIDNDVADKFRSFDKVKKGVISSEVIYSIKPELIITFPKYQEKISFATALKRLAISNVLITEKYGRKDLKVTPEQLGKALDELIEKNEIKLPMNKKIDNNLLNKFSNLEQELKEKDSLIEKQQKEITDLKRKEIVYTTVISEYEDNEQLEKDIKLVA
ncbi:MAG: hypothetical protein E7157_05710 [Lactobacillales bacterium]|nr:hypothetical protein [Lactobacillales bacterium]